jgi:hypothetical protein
MVSASNHENNCLLLVYYYSFLKCFLTSSVFQSPCTEQFRIMYPCENSISKIYLPFFCFMYYQRYIFCCHMCGEQGEEISPCTNCTVHIQYYREV